MYCISLLVLLSFFFWPLYYLFFFDLRLLINGMVSSNFWPLHCLFFDLRLLITGMVSSNFWPLYCLLFFDLRLLITGIVSSNFWPLYCLFFFDLRLLITGMVSSNFWPLYCLFFFDLRLLITGMVSSNFWPLYCLFFFDLRLLIIVSSNISNDKKNYFNFPIVLFIYSDISAAHAYWLYMFFSKCDILSCVVFCFRQQLPLLSVAVDKETTGPKLHIGKVEVITSKGLQSPSWLVDNYRIYLCHRWPRKFSVCHSYRHVLFRSQFSQNMTYHRIFNICNTTMGQFELFCIVFYGTLFLFLSFFCWPLYCLSFEL